jgi:hypothetical protein
MRSAGGMAGSSWRRGNPQQQRSLLLPGLAVVSSSRRAAIGENRLLRDAIKAAAVGLAHTFLALSRGRSNVCLPEKQAKTAREACHRNATREGATSVGHHQKQAKKLTLNEGSPALTTPSEQKSNKKKLE